MLPDSCQCDVGAQWRTVFCVCSVRLPQSPRGTSGSVSSPLFLWSGAIREFRSRRTIDLWGRGGAAPRRRNVGPLLSVENASLSTRILWLPRAEFLILWLYSLFSHHQIMKILLLWAFMSLLFDKRFLLLTFYFIKDFFYWAFIYKTFYLIFFYSIKYPFIAFY